MSDAGKTPVPGSGRNGNGLPRLTVPMLGGAILAIATVTTSYVFATKSELKDHAAEERGELTTHAVSEAKTTADLALESALHKKELEIHDKLLERVLNTLDVVYTNQATMMRAVEIPAERIARPKKEK